MMMSGTETPAPTSAAVSLTRELWWLIGEYVTVADVNSLLRTCRQLRATFDDQLFWRALVLRDFGVHTHDGQAPSDDPTNWKDGYYRCFNGTNLGSPVTIKEDAMYNAALKTYVRLGNGGRYAKLIGKPLGGQTCFDVHSKMPFNYGKLSCCEVVLRETTAGKTMVGVGRMEEPFLFMTDYNVDNMGVGAIKSTLINMLGVLKTMQVTSDLIPHTWTPGTSVGLIIDLRKSGEEGVRFFVNGISMTPYIRVPLWGSRQKPKLGLTIILGEYGDEVEIKGYGNRVPDGWMVQPAHDFQVTDTHIL